MQNLNLNPNFNVQMIFVEPRDPNVAFVTQGGAMTESDHPRTTAVIGAIHDVEESTIQR